MSGGHFDYQQYTLREIADTIERDIARAMAPKPPKRHEDYWTIYEMTRPFSYHSLHNAFQEFDSYDKALKYLNAMEDVIKAAKEYECWRLLEEEVLFESTRRNMLDTFEGTKSLSYIQSDTVCMTTIRTTFMCWNLRTRRLKP